MRGIVKNVISVVALFMSSVVAASAARVGRVPAEKTLARLGIDSKAYSKIG